jgi:SPOR domain
MKRRCPSCGQMLAKGASFCRTCGARYAVPPPPPRAPKPQAAEYPAPASEAGATGRRRNQVAIAVSVAILVVGAGTGAAILLGAGGGSSTTTVVQGAAPTPEKTATDPEETAAEAGDPIEAGHYIQAGSFQTAAHAEAERQRLAGHGIYVEVVSSDSAQELYPGFQVLLGGPLQSHGAEVMMLKSLHQNGVPSAFARELTPAASTGEPVAGRWAGEVERTSAEHPSLDGSLPVTLAITSNGTVGSLDFSTIRCHADLSLTSTANHVLTYSQEPACAGAGTLQVRPAGDELMLTLLSARTDAFALGTLDRS